MSPEQDEQRERDWAAECLRCWTELTDKECQRRYGLSLHDLADCPTADWYADGVEPEEAARMAFRAEFCE